MAANGTEAVSVSNLKAVVDNLSTRVDAGGGVVLFSGEITSATIPLSADPTTFGMVEVMVNELFGDSYHARYFYALSPQEGMSVYVVGGSTDRCTFSGSAITLSTAYGSGSSAVVRGYRF